MGSSWTRGQTHVPCVGRHILNHWTTREVPSLICIAAKIFLQLPAALPFLFLLLLVPMILFVSLKFHLVSFDSVLRLDDKIWTFKVVYHSVYPSQLCDNCSFHTQSFVSIL